MGGCGWGQGPPDIPPSSLGSEPSNAVRQSDLAAAVDAEEIGSVLLQQETPIL